MKNIFVFLLIMLFANLAYSQIENVSVSHPVYKFLSRYETMGLLEHKSLSSLPLQRMEVSECLSLIKAQRESLSHADRQLLDKYLIEFEVEGSADNAVLFYSPSDSTQVFSTEMFSAKEKFLYR